MSNFIPHPAESFIFGGLVFAVIVFYSVFLRKPSRNKIVYSLLFSLMAFSVISFFIGGKIIQDAKERSHAQALKEEAEDNSAAESSNNNPSVEKSK